MILRLAVAKGENVSFGAALHFLMKGWRLLRGVALGLCRRCFNCFEAAEPIFTPIGVSSLEFNAGDEKAKIKLTENRVWVTVNTIGIGFPKEEFIEIIKATDVYKFAHQSGEAAFKSTN